jgi:hypothetical protein
MLRKQLTRVKDLRFSSVMVHFKDGIATLGIPPKHFSPGIDVLCARV